MSLIKAFSKFVLDYPDYTLEIYGRGELEEELRKIDPNNPILSKVGSDFIKGIKVVHDIPMKSMDKIHTKNELEKSESHIFIFSIPPDTSLPIEIP